MRKALIGLMLVIGIVGCKGREKSSDSEADSAKSGPLLNHREAEQILRNLPEVVKWSRQVESKSGGKVRPVCKAEVSPADCKKAGKWPVWIFKFCESDKTQTVLWQRFQVDAVSGDVGVWDPFKGRYTPLADWRGRFQPP